MKKIFKLYATLTAILVAGLFGCAKVVDVEPLQSSTKQGNINLLNEEGITLVVATTPKQQLRLGIDAERLWYWRSTKKTELAMAAVSDLQADYVRIAINCAYERENCVKNETAYKEILEMMTVMRAANPTIKFFASPRPLHEAYSAQEKEDLFGDVDNVPWSPYPLWIQQWRQNGTRVVNGKTVPKFDKAYFDASALVQYFADYLNLMYAKGFDIAYLDVSNEQTIITPAINKYLYDRLPLKLNAGVNMPILVVPSTWNTQGGIDWLRNLNQAKGEHLAFGVASTHNTGDGGSLEEFTSLTKSFGKEAWNTELHGWVGLELKDEILNSSVLWEHLRAGYSGIDTWLFFGPLGGTAHSMVNSNGTVINTAGKYEIFKQVVNNANRGYYLDITQPSGNLRTTAFIKGNVLSVWVLNKSTSPLQSVKIDLSGYTNIANKVEVLKWQENLPKEGSASEINLTNPQSFVTDIDAETLYFFKLKLN